MSAPTSPKVFLSIGLALVLAGLLLNEWTLAALFSPDGSLGIRNTLLVRIFDTAGLGIGATLIALHRRLSWVKLGLLVGSGLATVVLAEVALRLTARETDLRIFRANPHGTGSYRMLPGLAYTLHYEILGVPLTYDIVTNSHGMRWREVSREKPEGVRRIAFVGDSFTFGESADTVEHSFVGVFERRLAAPDVEVLNFGMDGYGFDDMELYVREEVLSFEPDVVVLMSFNGNDWRDTYLGLNKFDVDSGLARWNPEVLAARVPAEMRGGRFFGGRVGTRERSFWIPRLYLRLVQHARRLEARRQGPPPPDRDPARFEVANELLSFSFWSRVDRSGVVAEAEQLSLAALDRLDELCGEARAKLILAAIPYEEQVYCEQTAGSDAAGVAYDVAWPQRRLEGWARERGHPYLDLLPPLRAHLEGGGADIFPNVGYAWGDIHLNNLGHALVGTLLVEFFQGLEAGR